MDTGRIQSIVIATASGNVVYERFYERISEHEKAELRASLAETADASSSTREEPEFAARYRSSICSTLEIHPSVAHSRLK